MSKFHVFNSELLGEKYYKTVHNSGLTVCVFPKEMSTTYGILSVNFGGNDTKYRKNGKMLEIPEGCAHFLEHKLFDNPDGTNADDIFSALGAYCNAYTSNDRTAYLFSSTENEDECLEHLIKFVTSPYFTDATVNKEIGIIAQEIRGCIDDPYDRCYIGMLEGMYHNDPVRNEICGSEESISKISPELLYRLCQDFYIPSNMLLCVCGRIAPEKVLSAVDKLLGQCQSDIAISEGFEEPENVACAFVEKKMPVGKPIFSIGVKDTHIPTDPYERYRRSETINILVNMMFSETGEFYNEMLEKELLAPGFDTGYSANSNTAYIMMSGESNDPESLLERIKKYIRECVENGLDKRDFIREKRCMYASYVSEFDSTEDIAFAMCGYAWEGLDLFVYPSLIDSITFDDVKKIANEIFKDEYFTLSVVRPIGKGEENVD